MSELNAFAGGCHCGALTIAFSTALAAGDFHPRRCDCAFCMKHAAQYISDPAGALRVEVKEEDCLEKYRQGSGTADFLLCRRCGVLVAVVFEQDGERWGAINARCLDGGIRLGEAMTVSPKELGRDQKIARWNANWTRDVRIGPPR